MPAPTTLLCAAALNVCRDNVGKREAAAKAEREAAHRRRETLVLSTAMPAIQPRTLRLHNGPETDDVRVHAPDSIAYGVYVVSGAVEVETGTAFRFASDGADLAVRETLPGFPLVAATCPDCGARVEGPRARAVRLLGRDGEYRCTPCHARHVAPLPHDPQLVAHLERETDGFAHVLLPSGEGFLPGAVTSLFGAPRSPQLVVTHPHEVRAMSGQPLWLAADHRLVSVSKELARRGIWLALSFDQPEGTAGLYTVQDAPIVPETNEILPRIHTHQQMIYA